MWIRKWLLNILTMLVVGFACVSPGFAQELTLDEELTQLETEYEQLLDDMAAERDAALKNADDAERRSAANAAKAETFQELYLLERQTALQPRPNKWVWFALGGVSAAAAATTVALVVRLLVPVVPRPGS